MIRYIYLSIVLLSFSAISCRQSTPEVTKESKDTAIEIAAKTQKALGKGLKEAINKHGIINAIAFCNDTAEILTSSMANILGANIKRVSDKNRNPNNTAKFQELAYIENSKRLLSKGKSIKPEFILKDGLLTAYIPIMTKPMCLSCHGNNSIIHADVQAKLKELYPKDKALNYKDGDLRGIWVVRMDMIQNFLNSQ